MGVQFIGCDRWATTQSRFWSSIASLRFRNATSRIQPRLGYRRQSLKRGNRRLDSPKHTYDQKDKTTQDLLAKHMATQLNQG